MNEKEHEETLENIQTEVQDSAIEIGRIDERTRKMETKIDGITDQIEKNRRSIDDLEADVKRNSTLLNGVVVGATTLIIWLADKVGGIF